MAIRLLLVTSPDGDRSSARRFLEESGYEVEESADGPETGRVAETFRPELVLLDDEAGQEARMALRSSLGPEAPRRVPVVEMSLARPGSYRNAAAVLERVTRRRVR